MLKKLSYNILIAIEAIGQNKLRAILTSLGIIFGVASVIAMLAIGRGAQVEILEQMKLLGANNIIVRPVVEQKQGAVAEDEEEQTAKGDGESKNRYSPGLTLDDAESIMKMIPGVEMVSPEVVYETTVTRAGYRRSGRIVGVGEHYLTTSGFSLAEGSGFTGEHHTGSQPVAIIGSAIKTRFFPKENPIGKQIKCGEIWFTVVGVLDRIAITADNIQHLGIRDYNLDIYTPITTALIRYKNRAKFTPDKARGGMIVMGGGMIITSGGSRSNQPVDPNYHQIDRMVVRVSDTQLMPIVAEVMSRMLERRHNQVVDYEIVVPELLLKQEQRTKDIFNIVLAAIASISLIVGGIGIMNIMLASVMERIREIGVRMSLGATQKDIILQFLSEAVAISINGGIIGILLGVAISYLIEQTTGIVTIVSPFSVVISFSVAITVGLIFGIFPARKAAMQDPATSLRYE